MIESLLGMIKGIQKGESSGGLASAQGEVPLLNVLLSLGFESVFAIVIALRVTLFSWSRSDSH